MVYLTEKYWESFKKDSNSKVFDGNKFEKLVLSILKEIFNGQWEATQQTWDGGKDFYQKNDLYLDWAECKIHKDNIDIKTIGKTLVMAIIEENVKKIFFFSHSPMVSTAYKHLATFSKNSNINIIAYDDIKLEELILNTTTTKKHYFNDFPLGNYPFNKKDTIHTNISKDIDISILEVENLHKHKNRIEKFLYNQTFMLEIIIINNSIDEKKYEFDFSDFTNSEIKLWLLSDIDSEKYNNFKLAGCEVKSIVIFLKSRKVGKTTIPQIKINSPANNDSVTQIYTQKKDIEVAFISHPIFVSLKLEEIISKFESCISSNNKLELHVIFGSSGVGKSRLSLEFRDKLLRQNYSIFQYDCNSPEYYLANTFSQKLLSYLYKVPIVHDKTENSKFNLLTSLINGNNTVNKHNMNDIVDLIIVGIKKYRLSLIIDNVQSLESISFELLSKLYKKVYILNIQISIIFIFNLDELVFNTSSKIFFNELKEDNRNKQIELSEFKEHEARQFIDNLIKFDNNDIRFSEHYPKTIKLILDNVGFKALNLFQTILYLSDENIITMKDDFFIVKDINRFFHEIVILNKGIEAILDKRYSYLKKHHEHLVYALNYLAFFEEIDMLDIEHSSIKDSINKLIEINFLKNSNDVVSFYHGSIKKFIYKQEFWTNTNLTKNIISDKKGFYSDYRLTGFICYLIDESNDIDGMNKIFDFLQTTDLNHNLQTNLFAKLLEKKLRKNKKEPFIEYNKELILINKISSLLTFNLQMNDKVLFFKKLYIHRLDSFSLYETSYKELSSILRNYASWSCQVNKAQAGYDAIEEFLDKIDKFKDDTEQAYRIKADLKNRQCVNLKFLGKHSEAEKKGLESLNISKKYNLRTEECLNYIDLGYIFFGCDKNVAHLIKYWKKAIKIYNEHSFEICKYNLSMKYASMLIEVHLMVLNKETEAFTKINDLIQLCKSEYDSYYLKQFLMLDIVNNFIHKHFDNLINKINNVKDLSISTNEMRFYEKALYAESKYFYFSKQYDNSLKVLQYIILEIHKLDKKFIDSNFCLIRDYIQQSKRLKQHNDEMARIFQISNLTESDYLDNDFTTTFNLDGISLPSP